MIKTALKVYKNNIWHFFTILGFVSLGLIIGLSILIPNMVNMVNGITTDIKNAAGKIAGQDFNANIFVNSLVDQFKAMNWSNPLATLQNLLTQNKFMEIFNIALEKAGFNPAGIEGMRDTLTSSYQTLVSVTTTQLIALISPIAICSVCGYIFITAMIHFKTTKNYNVLRYIITTIVNIIFLVLVSCLFAITLKNLKGPLLVLASIGITLLYGIGILTISFLSYANEGTKFRSVVNIKTIIFGLIADIVVCMLSLLIVSIIYPFNALASILIAIPLIIITTIIINNTTDAFVANFNK